MAEQESLREVGQVVTAGSKGKRPYRSAATLLVVELLLAITAYLNNFLASGLFGVCGYDNPRCDYWLEDFAFRFAALGIPTVAVLTTTLGCICIIRQRPSHRIPITGMTIIAAIAGTSFVMMVIAMN
jgi:hypothetical protein